MILCLQNPVNYIGLQNMDYRNPSIVSSWIS